jgi:hypothetical protein
MMFSVDERFELGMPTLLQEEGVRRFWVVEQCFNHPLWQIHVLSPSSGEEGEVPCWTRLLVTRTSDALGVLLGEKWERAEAYLILPSYMTGRQGPLLTKCSAVWECEGARNEGRATWLLETDLGEYVDPHHGVKLANAKRVALRWTDQRGEKSVGSHAT